MRTMVNGLCRKGLQKNGDLKEWLQVLLIIYKLQKRFPILWKTFLQLILLLVKRDEENFGKRLKI